MPTMMVAMRVVMTLTTTCAPSALLAQDENRTKMQEDDITDKIGRQVMQTADVDAFWKLQMLRDVGAA